MLDYLKKFNSLSSELRQKVSNPKAMATIEILEKKYGLLLAALVMKVMAREVALKDLAAYLKKEDLSDLAAGQLARELNEKVFFSLVDYLPTGQAGLSVDASAPVKPANQKPPAKTPTAAVDPVKIPAVAPSPASEPPAVKLGGFLVKPASQAKLDGEPKVQGASFLFSAADEAEIIKLTKQIDSVERKELPVATIEENLKDLLDRVQINFGSADLADRFKQILKTYLRGIRDKLDTKLALTKPFSSGGLSFDENSAQKVMDIADKVLNSRPGEAVKPFPKIKIPLPAIDAPYDFSKLAKEEKISAPAIASAGELNLEPKAGSEPIKSIPLELTDYELAPLTPAIVKQPVKKNIIPAPKKKFFQAVPEKKIRPAYPPTCLPDRQAGQAGQAGRTGRPAAQTQPDDLGQMPLIRRRFEAENLNMSQKVRVEDVKYVPKVMSPLDELKYMDLVNFRRLDKEPALAVEKINNKIDLLAEENYGKKLEGIRLWRSSPISKLYLTIGRLSISENKPVDVIIEERKMVGREYLTAAEFKAIMDLNKSLRF